MDDNKRELMSLLCTKIGMLMKDYSTPALTVGNQSDGEQKVVVDELAEASTKISKLVAADQSIAD